MKKLDFTLGSFVITNNRPDIYFRKYFKKENDLVQKGETICSIRVGKYESSFGHQLVEIKSPEKGYLIQTRKLDDNIYSEQFLFSLSECVTPSRTLTKGEVREHFFTGQGSSYSFINWSVKNETYVKYNQPIYAFSVVKENYIIHYAEVSGKITMQPIPYQYLTKGKLLYKIEYSEPFITDSKDINELEELPCFVYLMKDCINNYYKIGISNNPTYREKTLQSEKPTIELVIAKKFPSRQIAESFEKALHKSFEQQRIRGEWFNLTQQAVLQIIESLN